MLPDPYESKMVYVGKSSIAGEGLFALHDLQPDVRALASHDEHMLEWTS
jgi:hypothetical protein